MFDGQHDSRASVGSNVLLRKQTRKRVALSAMAGVPSALTPLLIKEAGFVLSENRQGCRFRLRVSVPLWPGYKRDRVALFRGVPSLRVLHRY